MPARRNAAKFLLRLYVEKRDPKYKPALDKAIQFVLDSQYPIGAWPQRFPLQYEFSHHGMPDYTSYLTFNDDVAAENIDFLVMCYQALGDRRAARPDHPRHERVSGHAAGSAAAGLGAAVHARPEAGRRAHLRAERARHPHDGTQLELLIKFYRLTGETKFLARMPEALDWLDALKLPPGVAPPGRTHPTFIELGTNKPLYVHREGSNVVNGRYYVDYDPKKTLAHYSAFRRIDMPALRKRYAEAKALSPADAAKDVAAASRAPA